ncbi:hypothetical protein [Yoonia sp.]|uniref:hypothetical protein n=1 Tax=Yoonia sp. TaxID=2212373 RepID=UPI001A0BFC3E|nr:hypothetical protein [Yoonia sp.]MBE0414617.1 hypothetical protein [Yoonia sp.]
MDTSLNIAAKGIAAVASVAEPVKLIETTLPVVIGAAASVILPADKIFIAQVVTARLSGTEFPENPGEIAPADRTLKPYDVPMLPFDKPSTDHVSGPSTAAAPAIASASMPADTYGKTGAALPSQPAGVTGRDDRFF